MGILNRCVIQTCSLEFVLCFSHVCRHSLIYNWMVFSHERTPMDEAVTRGKLDVIDAINSAVAQQELAGVTVS